MMIQDAVVFACDRMFPQRRRRAHAMIFVTSMAIVGRSAAMKGPALKAMIDAGSVERLSNELAS
jgi:hypothetical protein